MVHLLLFSFLVFTCSGRSLPCFNESSASFTSRFLSVILNVEISIWEDQDCFEPIQQSFFFNKSMDKESGISKFASFWSGFKRLINWALVINHSKAPVLIYEAPPFLKKNSLNSNDLLQYSNPSVCCFNHFELLRSLCVNIFYKQISWKLKPGGILQSLTFL